MTAKTIEADLIIFDLDGTLLDSVGDIVKSVEAMLEHLGLPARTPEEIRASIGFGNLKLLSDALGSGNRSLMEKAIKFYWGYYFDHCLDNTKPYPDAAPVLDYFKHKKKTILSNKLKQFVVNQLESFNMLRYFEDVAGGDDEKCIKPMACSVERVLDKFTVEKSRAVMVGDMAVDVKAGKASGIKTCAVTYGLGRKEDLEAESPDFTISRLIQLKEIIR